MKTSAWCILGFLTSVQCTIVEIPNGKLQGNYNGKYYSFTNIRFGKAPRFKAPILYTDPWTGVQNATLPTVNCVQFGKSLDPSNGVEDCLTLNIFTPDIKPKTPYIVRIHIVGGGFMTGSTADIDETYVLDQDEVLVLPNYRLGPFGFLSDGSAGNFGLKDQQLALKWVHQNIHAFGGDPSKVLLTGVSAGGMSVHLQLLSPGSWDYFHAAISSSGCALNPWAIEPDPKKVFQKYIGRVGCDLPNPDDVKQCLQDRTKEEHFLATNAMQEFHDDPAVVFEPSKEAKDVESAFLTEDPLILIQRGLISTAPWVVARSVREGSTTAAEFLRKDENGNELIEVLNYRWRELAPIIMFYNNNCVDCDEAAATKYRNDYSDYLLDTFMQGKNFSVETYPLLERMFSTVAFVNGLTQAVLMHGMYSMGPVYAYVYTVPLKFGTGNNLSRRFDISFGADHGADTRYVVPSKIYRSIDKLLNKTESPNERFISKNLINLGRSLVLSGSAEYGGHKLPINNKTQVGKLTIFKDSYEFESYSPETRTFTRNIYNNTT